MRESLNINEEIIAYGCRPSVLQQWLNNENTIDSFYDEYICI